MQARGTPSCGACAVRRPRVRWPLMWQGLPNKPEGRERLDPVTEEPTVTYETQTVKCLRGLESRTVKKWEDAGWEIVSHKQGALQSEIQIRRPKPKTPWKLYAIVGGVVGVLLVTLIVNGIIRERSAQPATAPAAMVRMQIKCRATRTCREREPTWKRLPRIISSMPSTRATRRPKATPS